MEGATLSTGCFRTSYQFLVPSVVYSLLSGCSALVLEHASLSSAGAQSMPAHTFTVERLLPFSCFLTTSLLTCSHVWHLQRPPLAAPQGTFLSVPRVDMQTWCALFSPCAVKLHWAHLSAHYNSCLPLMPQAWGAILPSAMTSASSYQGHEKVLVPPLTCSDGDPKATCTLHIRCGHRHASLQENTKAILCGPHQRLCPEPSHPFLGPLEAPQSCLSSKPHSPKLNSK